MQTENFADPIHPNVDSVTCNRAVRKKVFINLSYSFLDIFFVTSFIFQDRETYSDDDCISICSMGGRLLQTHTLIGLEIQLTNSCQIRATELNLLSSQSITLQYLFTPNKRINWN